MLPVLVYDYSVTYITPPYYPCTYHSQLLVITGAEMVRAKTYRVDINNSTNITEQISALKKQDHLTTEHHLIILTQHSFFLLRHLVYRMVWFGFELQCLQLVPSSQLGLQAGSLPISPTAAFSHGCQGKSILLFQHSRRTCRKHKHQDLINQASSHALSMDTASFKCITMDFRL